MLLLAHRGANVDAPENTLPAFRLALAQGADGVELDARLCGTGEVVVCHDDDLTRLAGLDWKVSRTPWRKLQRVDLGAPSGWSGEKASIPRLEEVLEALPEHALVNVELKSNGADDGGLSAQVAKIVRWCRAEPRVLISSFDPLCLARIAVAAPELRRGQLVDPDKSFAWQSFVWGPLFGGHSIHVVPEAITEPRMRMWKAGGVRVAAWTVNSREEALRLRALGVAYCITDRPKLLREVLGAPDVGDLRSPARASY